MRCIDEGRTNPRIPIAESDAFGAHGSLVSGLFDGVRHRMMPQVTGHIHVDAGGTNLVEQRVAGTRQDGHRLNERIHIATDLNTKFRVGQRVRHALCEIAQPHRFGQSADSAQTDGMFGPFVGDGFQRTLFDQSEHVGCGHADATV